MFDDMPSELIARLTATSYALSLRQDLQDIADKVYDLNASGATERDINRRIHRWMKEKGLDYESWLAEVEPELEQAGLVGRFDLNKMWIGYGVEPWLRECIRSVAFTNEPIPFLPFAAGYWIEDTNSEEPRLIAVLTPLSDPHLAARQLVEKHKKVFGTRASGSPRKDEVENARMLALHHEGMSYKEIAIQNLRARYPDIVTRPDKYRTELTRETERVKKAVPAAERLWKERGVDSSLA
jgi:hypothetical protein